MDYIMSWALGIAGLIFQAKVTKFGTNVGLSMLVNISSGFYHMCQKKKKELNFLHILQLCTLKN